MSLGLILIIVLIVLMVGGLPSWPYARGYGYGYYPSSIFGIILLVVLILLLTGRL